MFQKESVKEETKGLSLFVYLSACLIFFAQGVLSWENLGFFAKYFCSKMVHRVAPPLAPQTSLASEPENTGSKKEIFYKEPVACRRQQLFSFFFFFSLPPPFRNPFIRKHNELACPPFQCVSRRKKKGKN
mmetsp:Transcript_6167/g.15242  ORF Transcript_6167/g.15242 Transcript_6167/m.15242 type:complete len:130 (-) Transcript_6167:271-660(-)